jgi:hypothetical protein
MAYVIWYVAFFGSALLYAMPFFFESMWWLVFVCFMPFLWAVSVRSAHVVHGCAWGVAAWSLHLCGVLYGVASGGAGVL